MSQTLILAKELIAKSSVTPDDKGCQDILISRLASLGFQIERLKFDNVDNFWALKTATKNPTPTFVFAGHTDVVPAAEATWQTDPFTPTVKNGVLYGRGAADMKGSLAAMIVATERFVADFPEHHGSIGFLITADEEGEATNGTIKVAEHLRSQGQQVDFCLIGEPSSTKILADTIKNGRRGSLNGKLKIIGLDGHIAYPHLANNAIHLALPALLDLQHEVWDEGNQYFAATSFQISNIHSGSGVVNVVPGEVEAIFNFRYSTESTSDGLQKRVAEILDKHDFKYQIEWQHSGAPFLTAEGDLVAAIIDASLAIKGIKPELSTSGGTSDGRFIAPILKSEVVELGPINATIHKPNECVLVQDLDDLTDIYYQILKNILT